MEKLTDEGRAKVIKDLRAQVADVIEYLPRGITETEIRNVVDDVLEEEFGAWAEAGDCNYEWVNTARRQV